jgi:hypothetical protein
VCGNILLRRPELFWAVEIAEDDVILMTICTVIRICHFPKQLWLVPDMALDPLKLAETRISSIKGNFSSSYLNYW